MPEHRRDSEECFSRHKRWTDEYIGARLKVVVGTMLLGLLGVGVIVFSFVSKYIVATDNERDDTKYVMTHTYEKDQKRIQNDLSEIKIEQKELSVDMKQNFQHISEKLDAHAERTDRTP